MRHLLGRLATTALAVGLGGGVALAQAQPRPAPSPPAFSLPAGPGAGAPAGPLDPALQTGQTRRLPGGREDAGPERAEGAQPRPGVRSVFPPPVPAAPGQDDAGGFTAAPGSNVEPVRPLFPPQPDPWTGQPPRPGTADTAEDPPPLPGGLRGALGLADPTAAQAPTAATGAAQATGSVRPPPTTLESRTRANVQGPVRPGVQRPVRAERAPVLDGRASSGGAPVVAITAPRPERVTPDADAFSPLGLRIGNLILRPAIEVGAGTTSNAANIQNRTFEGRFSRITPEFQLDSDWAVHRLNLRGRIDRQDFFGTAVPVPERTDATFEGSGQFDISRQTSIEAGASYLRRPDPLQGSFPQPLRERPTQNTASANLALNHSFNRFGFRLRGAYDNISVTDTVFADGTRVLNAGRDADVFTGTLRLGYEISPVLFPYVEAISTSRTLRNPAAGLGSRPGSDGLGLRAGVAFTFAPMFTGEIAAGLQRTVPRDIPGTVPFLAPIVDGRIAWAITPLTTLRLTATTSFLDSPVAGSSGANTYDATFGITHQLQRNITLDASLGFGLDSYQGIVRTDRRLSASFGALWSFNRHVALRLAASHTMRESNVANFNVQTTTIEAALRFAY